MTAMFQKSPLSIITSDIKSCLLLLDLPATKPKRSPNSFIIWGRQNRGVVAQAHPDLQNRQISTLLGQIWADLPAEARQPYYDEAPRLQRLFDKQAGECAGKS